MYQSYEACNESFELPKVALYSYISGVMTDTIICTPFRFHNHNRKEEVAKISSRLQCLTHYLRGVKEIVIDPNRLLVLPIPSVLLYSSVHIARQAVIDSVDSKLIRVYKNAISESQSSGWQAQFPCIKIAECQKKYKGRANDHQEVAMFYAKQLLTYLITIAFTIFGGISHAAACSVFKVLNFRRAELDHRGRLIYPNFWFSLRESHRRRGLYAWFPTCMLMGTSVHLFCYSLPLLILSVEVVLNDIDESKKEKSRPFMKSMFFGLPKSERNNRCSFEGMEKINATISLFSRAFMFSSAGVFVCVPIMAAKNAYLRDVWLQNLYNTEVRTFRQWYKNERVILRSMLRSSRKYIIKNGIGRFLCLSNSHATPGLRLFSSVFHLICRKSIPFGFCWALYRAIEVRFRPSHT